MDARTEHLMKIAEAKKELAKAQGPRHKRDCKKHLFRLKKELATYDRLRRIASET